MAVKRCLGCGAPTRTSRCAACSRWHPRGRAYDRLRAQILDRDGAVCHLCGRPGASVVDHVVPLAQGGHPTDPANLRAAHNGCNLRKGARDGLPPPSARYDDL
jgi:5-methylcytosine-specific restriction endonuclease McrA